MHVEAACDRVCVVSSGKCRHSSADNRKEQDGGDAGQEFAQVCKVAVLSQVHMHGAKCSTVCVCVRVMQASTSLPAFLTRVGFLYHSFYLQHYPRQ